MAAQYGQAVLEEIGGLFSGNFLNLLIRRSVYGESTEKGGEEKSGEKDQGD